MNVVVQRQHIWLSLIDSSVSAGKHHPVFRTGCNAADGRKGEQAVRFVPMSSTTEAGLIPGTGGVQFPLTLCSLCVKNILSPSLSWIFMTCDFSHCSKLLMTQTVLSLEMWGCANDAVNSPRVTELHWCKLGFKEETEKKKNSSKEKLWYADIINLDRVFKNTGR